MTTRRCGCCREYGHFKPKCPNKDRVAKEIEEKKQEKIRMREVKRLHKQYKKIAKQAAKKALKKKNELKKKIKGDARQTMLGRAGSSRNGFVRTYTVNHTKQFNHDELMERNSFLKVDPKICFWCKVAPKTAEDHYIPTCCTKHDKYGMPHELNMFPSCNNCNSKLKGGKQPEKWNEILKEKFHWSDKDIHKLNTWREKNYSKLILPATHHPYLKRNFETINTFHKIADMCAATGKDINDFIWLLISPPSPFPSIHWFLSR